MHICPRHVEDKMGEDWKDKLSKVTGRPLHTGGDMMRRDTPPSERHKKSASKQPKGASGIPARWLPLYQDLGRKAAVSLLEEMRPELRTAHTGLLFDKFCDVWSGPSKWNPETPKQGKAMKHQFMEEIVRQLGGNYQTEGLLKQYHQRREALLKTCSGRSKRYATTWRFVSGLGMSHVLETGFVWHRMLGVPYLPGSSVKGLIRAWAEQWGGLTDQKEVKRLFGPRGKDAREEPATGALIVFEAMPSNKPILEVDIMNPHYGDYYSKKDRKGKLIPPADYLSPNPIFFVTVAAGASFTFALAPRSGVPNKDDLNKGFELLSAALENIGAGGKTAVGYGYFKIVP
jgi:CRISPR-associated protein Cmr6